MKGFIAVKLFNSKSSFASKTILKIYEENVTKLKMRSSNGMAQWPLPTEIREMRSTLCFPLVPYQMA